MSETIYPKGMFYNDPKEGAPEFVKGRISVKSKEFVEFLKEHTNEAGYVNLQVLAGDKGTYLKLDTWKPEKEKETAPQEEDLPF